MKGVSRQKPFDCHEKSFTYQWKWQTNKRVTVDKFLSTITSNHATAMNQILMNHNTLSRKMQVCNSTAQMFVAWLLIGSKIHRAETFSQSQLNYAY